jgi:membrane protein YqaA with SNARE-associated domain
MEFLPTKIQSYNIRRKRINAILNILVLLFILSFIIIYFLIFQDSDLLVFKIIKTVFIHIKTTIFQNPSYLGVIYAAFFGGLFFIFMPGELLFINFIKTLNPWISLLLHLSFFALSFSVNYFIGLKFSNLTKKIVTPQKFYKIKGILNRRGSIAVFFINLIPGLPQQPLSAILGVFHYNLTRFYVYIFAAQTLKYIAIILLK